MIIIVLTYRGSSSNFTHTLPSPLTTPFYTEYLYFLLLSWVLVVINWQQISYIFLTLTSTQIMISPTHKSGLADWLRSMHSTIPLFSYSTTKQTVINYKTGRHFCMYTIFLRFIYMLHGIILLRNSYLLLIIS